MIARRRSMDVKLHSRLRSTRSRVAWLQTPPGSRRALVSCFGAWACGQYRTLRGGSRPKTTRRSYFMDRGRSGERHFVAGFDVPSHVLRGQNMKSRPGPTMVGTKHNAPGIATGRLLIG